MGKKIAKNHNGAKKREWRTAAISALAGTVSALVVSVLNFVQDSYQIEKNHAFQRQLIQDQISAEFSSWKERQNAQEDVSIRRQSMELIEEFREASERLMHLDMLYQGASDIYLLETALRMHLQIEAEGEDRKLVLNAYLAAVGDYKQLIRKDQSSDDFTTLLHKSEEQRFNLERLRIRARFLFSSQVMSLLDSYMRALKQGYGNYDGDRIYSWVNFVDDALSKRNSNGFTASEATEFAKAVFKKIEDDFSTEVEGFMTIKSIIERQMLSESNGEKSPLFLVPHDQGKD